MKVSDRVYLSSDFVAALPAAKSLVAQGISRKFYYKLRPEAEVFFEFAGLADLRTEDISDQNFLSIGSYNHNLLQGGVPFIRFTSKVLFDGVAGTLWLEQKPDASLQFLNSNVACLEAIWEAWTNTHRSNVFVGGLADVQAASDPAYKEKSEVAYRAWEAFREFVRKRDPATYGSGHSFWPLQFDEATGPHD